MPPPVKAPTGFDAPLPINPNIDDSAKDRSLEQAVRGANGFEGEDKDLDYILDYKGKRMRLIPLSLVCQTDLLQLEAVCAL